MSRRRRLQARRDRARASARARARLHTRVEHAAKRKPRRPAATAPIRPEATRPVPPKQPAAAPRRRGFGRHAARLAGVVVLLLAALVVYEVNSVALSDARALASGRPLASPAPAPEPPAPEPPAAVEPAPVFTEEELGAAARPGVLRLESSAGVLGSASVGWFAGGRAYLLTAHTAVHGVITDAHEALRVRRGAQAWTVNVVRSDKLTGLVLLRAEQRPGQPLWTAAGRPELAAGDDVVAVLPSAGRAAATVSAKVTASNGVLFMDAAWNPLLLGAPVLMPDGRLAGVVTHIGPVGSVRVSPIAGACEKLRRC